MIVSKKKFKVFQNIRENIRNKFSSFLNSWSCHSGPDEEFLQLSVKSKLKALFN